MRTRNLAELMESLARIGPAQVGSHVSGDEVGRALHIPGTTLRQRFGIPYTVVAVLDSLFGKLPWAEARAIATALPEAIGRPGKDLRRIVWQLLRWEVEALEACAAPLPKRLFYERLCRAVRSGLTDACRGCPWPGALDALDELPRTMPPPHGFEDGALLAQLEHEMRTALRSAIAALIMADQAVVAILRRDSAAAHDRDDILCIGGRAEERASRHAISALGAIAQAGGIKAALQEPKSDARSQVSDITRCSGFRRQAAQLLHHVHEA